LSLALHFVSVTSGNPIQIHPIHLFFRLDDCHRSLQATDRLLACLYSSALARSTVGLPNTSVSFARYFHIRLAFAYLISGRTLSSSTLHFPLLIIISFSISCRLIPHPRTLTAPSTRSIHAPTFFRSIPFDKRNNILSNKLN
jgi:hypothetical protein